MRARNMTCESERIWGKRKLMLKTRNFGKLMVVLLTQDGGKRLRAAADGTGFDHLLIN